MSFAEHSRSDRAAKAATLRRDRLEAALRRGLPVGGLDGSSDGFGGVGDSRTSSASSAALGRSGGGDVDARPVSVRMKSAERRRVEDSRGPVDPRKTSLTYSDDGMSLQANEILLDVLFEGEPGATPVEGDIVRVHYEGFLPDGTNFESSRKRGRPFQFKLGAGQVIRGWEFAILRMTRGSRARFMVPPSLAYGRSGRLPKIPPNTPLEFEVQLIDYFEPEVEVSPRDALGEGGTGVEGMLGGR